MCPNPASTYIYTSFVLRLRSRVWNVLHVNLPYCAKLGVEAGGKLTQTLPLNRYQTNRLGASCWHPLEGCMAGTECILSSCLRRSACVLWPPHCCRRESRGLQKWMSSFRSLRKSVGVVRFVSQHSERGAFEFCLPCPSVGSATQEIFTGSAVAAFTYCCAAI